MLMGSLVGWGILSPIAYYTGWAPGPIDDWKTGSRGWILWVSLGIMISDSITSLAIVLVKQCIAVYTSYQKPSSHFSSDYDVLATDIDDDTGPKDLPKEEQVSALVVVLGLFASIILCIITVQIVFGNDIMSVGTTCIAICLALFLSVLGVRALGETDLNPVSGIGKISQFIFAALMPNAIVANLIAGAIAEAGAQQAGDLMQDLKTGYLLEASPKAQFYGQVIGSFVSAFVATGAYLLYSSIYTIPSEAFSAPTAQVWLDMARLVNGQPLPPHVFEFIIIFSVMFGTLVIIKEVCREKKWSRWIPQGIAFAIGIYNPPNFTLARVIGGLLYATWETYCVSFDPENSWHLVLNSFFKPHRKLGVVAIIIVASGFVLGEGTCSIVNMILYALHVPRLE
jgi:OPT family oligopeptide transporter